jgi:hypothetical protein
MDISISSGKWRGIREYDTEITIDNISTYYIIYLEN